MCLLSGCNSKHELLLFVRLCDCGHSTAVQGLGEACAQVMASNNWRRTCEELTVLNKLRWEHKPIPAAARPRGDAAENGNGQRVGAKIWPRGRWGHTVTVLDKDTFMIFGGECNGATNDVHIYDCSKSEWSLVRCTGVYPHERFGHACVLYRKNALIFGGSGVYLWWMCKHLSEHRVLMRADWNIGRDSYH